MWLLLGHVAVVALEVRPVGDVVFEHDLFWVRRAGEELLAGADLLEYLLGLGRYVKLLHNSRS